MRFTSVVVSYLSFEDKILFECVSNLFVMGASAFPQNIGYNPTGLLAGLAYFSAAKIRDTYLKSSGPLVPA